MCPHNPFSCKAMKSCIENLLPQNAALGGPGLIALRLLPYVVHTLLSFWLFPPHPCIGACVFSFLHTHEHTHGGRGELHTFFSLRDRSRAGSELVSSTIQDKGLLPVYWVHGQYFNSVSDYQDSLHFSFLLPLSSSRTMFLRKGEWLPCLAPVIQTGKEGWSRKAGVLTHSSLGTRGGAHWEVCIAGMPAEFIMLLSVTTLTKREGLL